MKGRVWGLIVLPWLLLSALCDSLVRYWAESNGYAEHQADILGTLGYAAISTVTIVLLLIIARRSKS